MPSRSPNIDRVLERLIVPMVCVVFTLASAWGVNAYRFGSSDNAITIPFLKAAIDPQLYPGDYLIAQRPYYYTYLWDALGAVHHFGDIPLAPLFFVTYLIALAATFYAVYRLGRTLFGRRSIALLALTFLLFSRITFGGVETIERELNTRLVATPLVLLALDAFLARRRYVSCAMLGVAYLVHPLTANYGVAMLFVATMALRGESVARRLLPWGVFGLIASPILAWKLATTPPSLHLFSADPRWVAALYRRSYYHMFPSTWGWGAATHAAVVAALFATAWAHRNRGADDRHRVVLCWVAAIAAMCGFGALFSEWRPLGIDYVLQPFRSVQFMEYLVMLYAAHAAYRRIVRGTARDVAVALALGAGVLVGVRETTAALAVFLVTTLVLLRLRSLPRWDESRFAVATAALVAVTGVGCHGAGLARHDGSVASIRNVQDSLWLDVQRWASAHTRLAAGFIVPPGEEEFRVLGERTVYADWEDGGLMNSNPAFGLEWSRRIRMLGDDEDGESEHYRRLGVGRLRAIAAEMRRAGSRDVYFVWPIDEDSPRALPFPVRYRNPRYLIYEITRSDGINLAMRS